MATSRIQKIEEQEPKGRLARAPADAEPSRGGKQTAVKSVSSKAAAAKTKSAKASAAKPTSSKAASKTKSAKASTVKPTSSKAVPSKTNSSKASAVKPASSKTVVSKGKAKAPTAKAATSKAKPKSEAAKKAAAARLAAVRAAAARSKAGKDQLAAAREAVAVRMAAKAKAKKTKTTQERGSDADHPTTRSTTKPATEAAPTTPERAKRAVPTMSATTKASSPPAPAARPRRRVEPWTPREIPLHPLEGRAQDPRLAAALAARERWHGRSGRPALKSATQAVAFVRERHLVHLRAQSALPNLIDPLIGRACTAEERVEGPFAATLEAWSEELHAAPDLVAARLCFDQPTLIQVELWPCLAAVAAPREAEARGKGVLTYEAAEALEILDRRGEMAADRLARFLDLTPADFAKVQGELESRLAILSRPGLDEEDQPITVLEPLGRWAERAIPQGPTELELQRAWTFLFIAALRAAVVLWPEEVEALYPWSAAERKAAIAEAMSTGAVVVYYEDDHQAFVASPVPR